MRFLSLDLIATGPFTKQRFDLSGGNYGLHLIYGPNEAGKSSSLRAIHNFLFGFPHQSVDNFYHAYNSLRIGATLCRKDGKKLTAIRRKSPKNSIMDQDDKEPLDEQQIAEFLGHVDSELFQSMFGINHERLREGGQAIVKGQGRIGELLFSAGSGLAGLHPLLNDLQSQAEALLTRTARRGQLITTVGKYQQIQSEIIKADTTLDAWNELQEELNRCQRRKKELDQLIAKKEAERERLTNYRSAAKLISQWQHQQNLFQQLKFYPLLDDRFADRCQEGMSALNTAETLLAECLDQKQEVENQLEHLGQPDSILSQADLIIELRDRRTSYREATQSIPYQQAQLQSIEQQLDKLLAELHRDHPTENDLLISRDQVIRVQQLVSDRGVLDERLKNQQRQLQQTGDEIEDLQAQLSNLPAVTDLKRLQACVKTVQKNLSLEPQFKSLNQEISKNQAALSDLLKRLPMWQGTIDDLERSPLPLDATVDNFRDRFNEMVKRQANSQDRFEDEGLKQQQIDADLAQLKEGGQLPTEADLMNWRNWRNQIWQLIRREWKSDENTETELTLLLTEIGHPASTSLEETFLQSLNETDRIADRLRIDAKQIAVQQKLVSDLAKCTKRRQDLQNQLDQLNQEHQSLWQEWKRVWAPVAIDPMTPAEMKEWLRQVREMIEDASQVRELKNRRAELESDLAKVRDNPIQLLLELTGEDDSELSLQELVEKLTELRDRQKETQDQHESLTKQLEKLEQQRQSADTQLQEAQSDHQAWLSIWEKEMLRLGLEPQASVAQANARIELIHELTDSRHKRLTLAKQVDKLNIQIQSFVSDVKRLQTHFLGDADCLSPIEAFEVIWERFENAQKMELKRNDLAEQLQALAERMESASGQQKEAMILIDQLKRQADVQQNEELYQAHQRSLDRSSAENRLQELEEQIADFSEGKSLEEFMADVQLDSQQETTLTQRIETIETELETNRESRDQMIARLKEVEIELKKYDGNSTIAEKNAESQLVATRLMEEFQQWAVLKIAQTVLRRGIEDHRQKHQGPILQRASKIFSEMTLGQFTGLQADFDDRGEPILKGNRALANHGNGKPSAATVGVEGMSDGTCDQLYLALRLAILESWLTRHEPVPFIVDDILINFDDDRSKATLKVLVELSKETQVIFFTHHIHLVELAEQLESNQIIVHQL